jgi:mono/diheme cytochrome c family protein
MQPRLGRDPSALIGIKTPERRTPMIPSMTDPEIRRPAPPIALLALAVAAAAATAFAQDTNAQLHGRRIAEARCGQCHALGVGPSPLADAPPSALSGGRGPA